MYSFYTYKYAGVNKENGKALYYQYVRDETAILPAK